MQKPISEHPTVLEDARRVVLESVPTNGLELKIGENGTAHVQSALEATLQKSVRDIFSYHARLGSQIQFPIVQRCFVYFWAKGVELGYRWAGGGDVPDFSYDFDDLLNGLVGAQVPVTVQKEINAAIPAVSDLFVDWQDWLMRDPSLLEPPKPAVAMLGALQAAVVLGADVGVGFRQTAVG